MIANQTITIGAAPDITREISHHLDLLTALAHFTTFMVAADDVLRSTFNRQSHFNSSLASYIMRDLHGHLTKSFEPEICWKLAASIDAVTQLVTLTQGRIPIMTSQQQRKQVQSTVDIVGRLLKGDLEVEYIICMSPFSTRTLGKKLSWWCSKKRPFAVF